MKITEKQLKKIISESLIKESRNMACKYEIEAAIGQLSKRYGANVVMEAIREICDEMASGRFEW